MLPKTHVIIGFIASLLVFLLTGVGLFYSFVIFLSSFLMDSDHYLYYVFKKKDISLKNAYAWFIKRRARFVGLSEKEKQVHLKTCKYHLIVFHGIEFLAVLSLLSLYSSIFRYILAGAILHLLLDYIELFNMKIPLYTKMSQIYVYLINKNKKETY